MNSLKKLMLLLSGLNLTFQLAWSTLTFHISIFQLLCSLDDIFKNIQFTNKHIWIYFTPWLDTERGLVSLFGFHFLIHIDKNFHGDIFVFSNFQKSCCESFHRSVLKNGFQINLLDLFLDLTMGWNKFKCLYFPKSQFCSFFKNYI